MFNRLQRHNGKRGFTLVELAIVLAVTGVLFVGLYRLLSGGNQQVKDTAVASQHVQLLNAVKSYLATSDGAHYMGSKGSGNSFALTIPPAASAPAGDNSVCHAYMNTVDALGYLKTFCDYLPVGFSTSTTNAYGQSFNVQVLNGTIAASATTPSTYSFMIMTTGGDTILDADGGRISGQIGSDGGFIYSNTSVCAANTACGSYGAWQATPASYGFGSAPAGHVASRTYYAPEVGASDTWLARVLMSNDTSASNTTSPKYNTMTTALYMGKQNLFMSSDANTSSFENSGTHIYLQGGSIVDSFSNGNVLNIGPNGGYLSSASNSANVFVRLNTNCSVDSSTASADGLNYTAGDSPSQLSSGGNDCQAAINIRGDQNVVGLLQATTLYAGTFLYNSSDMRLKTDIYPIHNALDDVMKMKPVSFKFKAGGQKSLGFIAQDVEKIYPELVKAPAADQMKSVNYEGLIAPLVGAVQELKKENDDLRHQLHEQGLRQEKLEQSLKSQSN